MLIIRRSCLINIDDVLSLKMLQATKLIMHRSLDGRKGKGKHTYVSFLYLWVDVQDADLSCFYHLVYRVDLSAIQVPIIFAMLQETGIFDVTLHFAAGHEGVHLAIPLIHLWFSGGDWRIKRFWDIERMETKMTEWYKLQWNTSNKTDVNTVCNKKNKQ